MTLVKEIWIDEVLHVAFVRAHLGAVGLAVARAAVPLVARATLRDVPQLRTLGCTSERILSDLSQGIEIPPEIDWLPAEGAPSPGPRALPQNA